MPPVRRRPWVRFLVLLALAALVACDPEPGSLTDCEPAASPVPLETIDDTVPPTTDAELQAWLASGGYLTFLPESQVHDSAGPHGGQVRTFINRTLATSLTG